MTEAEVEQKFRKLCERNVPSDRCESIVNAVWKLEGTHDVGELLDLVRLQDK